MTTLAIIPARKGSKRLFGKNMKEFCGKPLVWWTMVLAKRFDWNKIWTVVSSDDKQIIKLALEMKIEARERPNELATDTSYIWDVVRHHLLEQWYDTVILLQPTSPLRIMRDIQDCLRVYHTNGNTITLTANCNYMFRPNGVCYVVNSNDLFERREPIYHNAVFTPPERSVDIDTQEDFDEAERMMNAKNRI